MHLFEVTEQRSELKSPHYRPHSINEVPYTGERPLPLQ